MKRRAALLRRAARRARRRRSDSWRHTAVFEATPRAVAQTPASWSGRPARRTHLRSIRVRHVHSRGYPHLVRSFHGQLFLLDEPPQQRRDVDPLAVKQGDVRSQRGDQRVEERPARALRGGRQRVVGLSELCNACSIIDQQAAEVSLTACGARKSALRCSMSHFIVSTKCRR